ncbi:uncharacterized protein UBRO2_04474 [Ustilago bromivora]|uniref:Nudix hydrolase domain-containing protein n=1 Tax=Ustilago bromivora TaxID=307758 RepID=A0A8H8QRU9_9BASI|nr:uncharacterized protein UBRO2_04474 [Ustilago bromivora]
MNSNTNGRVIQLDSYTGIFLPPHDWYSDPVNRYSLLVPSSSSNPQTEEDKRGFGKGTYNGIGGKLNPSETARESIIRETAEEINVNLLSKQRGYQKREEGWKSRFDLEVKFHPEPKKEDERPENQRTVKEWRLYVYDSGFS